MHLNSELIFEKHAKKYFSSGQRVLEIGPNGYPSYFRKMIAVSPIEWHTLDIGSAHIEGGEQNPNHIVSPSEYSYPIADNTYDVVLSGQVMEHVKKIWTWAEELKRITRKGGLIITIVPVSWPFHEKPVDCWRVYPDGMKALMEDKGLSIIECEIASFERLLIPASTPTHPGEETININRSISQRAKFIFGINKVLNLIPGLRKLRVSVPVAYDTVCICKKV
jgi:SAM-dependent methyltransferase